ncbi:hypothetical protein D3C77_433760 [compost metagenome]
MPESNHLRAFCGYLQHCLDGVVTTVSIKAGEHIIQNYRRLGSFRIGKQPGQEKRKSERPLVTFAQRRVERQVTSTLRAYDHTSASDLQHIL